MDYTGQGLVVGMELNRPAWHQENLGLENRRGGFAQEGVSDTGPHRDSPWSHWAQPWGWPTTSSGHVHHPSVRSRELTKRTTAPE